MRPPLRWKTVTGQLADARRRLGRLEASPTRSSTGTGSGGGLYDAAGNLVAGADSGGVGLSRPWLNLPGIPASSSFEVTTTSGSFADVWMFPHYKQHPQIGAVLLVRCSDGFTAGQVQLYDADGAVAIGSPVNIPAGNNGYVSLGPSLYPGAFLGLRFVSVQARRTAGSGTIGVRAVATTGGQVIAPSAANLSFGFTVTSADPWAPGGGMSSLMAENIGRACTWGNMHAYTFGGSIGDHLDTGIATDGAHPTNVYKWARDYTFVDNSIAHFSAAGLENKAVVLSMAPTTITGEPDFAYSFAAPLAANRDALAAWAVEVCAHYLPLGVRYFHFYNELKGYSPYQVAGDYLDDYNAIYTAVKGNPGTAAAQIGGPYQIVRQRQSGWEGSEVEGPFGAIFQGLLDDYREFITNAAGYDFLAVDLSAGDQTGDMTGDYNPGGYPYSRMVTYFSAFAQWLDPLLPTGKPVVCSEFYGFSGTDGDQFEQAVLAWSSFPSHRPTTVLIWNESDAIAGRIVSTSTGALATIGARMADMRSRRLAQ